MFGLKCKRKKTANTNKLIKKVSECEGLLLNELLLKNIFFLRYYIFTSLNSLDLCNIKCYIHFLNVKFDWNHSVHFFLDLLFSHPITGCHLWSSSLIGWTVTSRSFLHQNNDIQWNLKLWGELLTWKLLHMLDFVTDFASCHLLFVSC